MAGVNWTNVTDLGQLPAEANNVSGGSFWAGMFYMIWVILILMFVGFGFEVAMIIASFVALLIGLLFVYAGIMAWTNLLTVAGVLIFMFLYVIWSTGKNKS